MNKHRVGAVPKCGAADSIYFGNPGQFERDIQARIDANDYLDQVYEICY